MRDSGHAAAPRRFSPAAFTAVWMALGLLLVPGRAVAAVPDSPPVLLQDTLVLTPAEVSGTGLAPEVGVRVTIDRRGNVGKVEVTSIEPSTEYDDLFRSAAVDTLGAWRYAPARKDGEPVEATDLETLLSMDYAVFLYEDPGLHYAMSWMLVHFLMQGEPDWERERFPDLLLYLAEGYPTEAALLEVYGLTPAELEAPFRDYVKGF